MRSAQKSAEARSPAGHLGSGGPGFPGGPPPLPSPALLVAQSRGGSRSAQDARATGAVREGLAGAGSRNSTVGRGRPEAENLWREQG